MGFRMDVLQFELGSFREEMELNFSIVSGQFNDMDIKLDASARQIIRSESEDAASLLRQDRLEARVAILERRVR